MKKLFIVLAASVGFVACADNSNDMNDNGTGGSIDSAITAPPVNEPDHTTTGADTATINSGGVHSDMNADSLNTKGSGANDAGENNSPGKTGNDDEITR